MAGNIRVDGLGLSAEDAAMLRDRVGIVFHAAASVNFNERLDIALDTNVRGTMHVLEVCMCVGVCLQPTS